MTTEAAFPAYDRTFPNVGKGVEVLWRYFPRLAFLYSSSLIKWVQSQRFVAQLLKRRACWRNSECAASLHLSEIR